MTSINDFYRYVSDRETTCTPMPISAFCKMVNALSRDTRKHLVPGSILVVDGTTSAIGRAIHSAINADFYTPITDEQVDRTRLNLILENLGGQNRYIVIGGSLMDYAQQNGFDNIVIVLDRVDAPICKRIALSLQTMLKGENSNIVLAAVLNFIGNSDNVDVLDLEASGISVVKYLTFTSYEPSNDLLRVNGHDTTKPKPINVLRIPLNYDIYMFDHTCRNTNANHLDIATQIAVSMLRGSTSQKGHETLIISTPDAEYISMLVGARLDSWGFSVKIQTATPLELYSTDNMCNIHNHYELPNPGGSSNLHIYNLKHYDQVMVITEFPEEDTRAFDSTLLKHLAGYDIPRENVKFIKFVRQASDNKE